MNSNCKMIHLPPKTLLCLMGLFVLFAWSCNKPLHERWVYYDETHCADAWVHNNTNELLKDNIIAYFKTKDIEIYEIEIFTDREPESCYSCGCKTGRRIKCKIRKRDVDDMKQNGFYQ